MRIAYICTNLFDMDEKNKTGSGIFNHILLNKLADLKKRDLNLTAYASGSSKLPFRIKSIDSDPSSANPDIIKNNKHVMFELALISKALAKQNKFDLYHVNIGDGDLVMPFAAFAEKPILITLHNIINEEFTGKYFSLFKDRKNVYFVSASDYQRKILPKLNYVKTIYHGIDVKQFAFNQKGGKNIMWAGRLIPGKGSDIVIKLAKKLKHETKLFGVVKEGYEDWCKQNIKKEVDKNKGRFPISLYLNYDRSRLVRYFQTSKVFLLPTLLEEAFGFVYAESMACGTPVVSFVRGSAPEIIKDGVTGFLVNPSDSDIRGDWIVKKTGFAGLCEAMEKIYSMPESKYKSMRQACRHRAVDNFSADKMADNYLAVYKKLSK